MRAASMTKPQFGRRDAARAGETSGGCYPAGSQCEETLPVTSGLLQRQTGVIKAVDDISLFIRERGNPGVGRGIRLREDDRRPMHPATGNPHLGRSHFSGQESLPAK